VENNDTELLAGQVWHAPVTPPITDTDRMAWLAARQGVTLDAMRLGLDDEIDRARLAERRMSFREKVLDFMVPQAEAVRRAVPPELSENMHEAPHYSDLLPAKGGAV
jgi:hypothetical protein